jgi:hypothetical protein
MSEGRFNAAQQLAHFSFSVQWPCTGSFLRRRLMLLGCATPPSQRKRFYASAVPGSCGSISDGQGAVVAV